MSLGTGPDDDDRGVGEGRPDPTVIVTGSVGELHDAVARGLFAARTGPEDGAVVLASREPAAAVVRRVADGPIDAARLAVVDATPGEPAAFDAGRVRSIDPDAGPGGFEAAVEAALEWLGERGADRRHFLYDGLAKGERAAEADPTYDRAYRLAMAVGELDGLAVFAGDPGKFPEAVVGELTHLVDVHVDLRRRDGVGEIRWQGLVGGSDGWLPVGDVDFDNGGFR